MNIKLAENAGFCFGVKRAVEEAVKHKEQFHKNIYTLGPLIHNNDAVQFLSQKGIYPVELENLDQLNEGDVIIIRSHGISLKVLDMLHEKKLNIIDATCPYVKNIHKKVKDYSELGYRIVIVGDNSHPEVIGINGWCEDSAHISKDGTDLRILPRKVCVVAQTTEKQSNWEKVLQVVASQCKEIVAFNTICSATEARQKAAEVLSKEVDAMIVIGGRHSSNTQKLYEICKKNCSNTVLVENAGEIPESMILDKSIINLGVAAGASTPDWIIKEALLKMKDENQVELNEQLAFMQQNNKQIVVGDVVQGEIISVNEKDAFVNIGYKADGILPLSEVTREPNVRLDDLYKLGQQVEVKVISRRNEDGYVVLSRIELERESAFKEVKEAFEAHQTITIKVKEEVNGGIIATHQGIRIFIPASHIELNHVEDLSSYKGKEMEVYIIELKEERRNTKIVGSRREILKAQKEKQEAETWNTLEKGKVVTGEVKRLTDFGAFVDIAGVDGLLHVSEMSWGRIRHPKDVFKPGDTITAVILEADKENKKLSLSVKQLTEDPWNNVDEKYPVSNVVLGKVVRFAKFGAFIELEPGVDALVHISQISTKRIQQPSEALTIGEQVKAKIIEVNKEQKKIGLSIKEVDEF